MIGTLEGRRDGWEALKRYDFRAVVRITFRPYPHPRSRIIKDLSR